MSEQPPIESVKFVNISWLFKDAEDASDVWNEWDHEYSFDSNTSFTLLTQQTLRNELAFIQADVDDDHLRGQFGDVLDRLDSLPKDVLISLHD